MLFKATLRVMFFFIQTLAYLQWIEPIAIVNHRAIPMEDRRHPLRHYTALQGARAYSPPCLKGDSAMSASRL